MAARAPRFHQTMPHRRSGFSLRSQRVPVERMPLVVKDPVQRGQVSRVRVEPGGQMLGPDVDDGPAVTCGGHLRLRVIGDRNERHQARLLAGQTSDTTSANHNMNKL